MKLVSRLAIVAALGLAAPLGSAAYAQAVSPAVGKALQSASSAASRGNTAAATAAVNTARNAAKTPAERRKVSEMAAYVYTRAGQFSRAATELESVGASPRQLAPLYYRAGQYSKAIAAANRAGGTDMQVIVGQSYLKTGENAKAVGVYEKLARSNPKYLENLAAAQYKSGDKKAYLATTEKLIRFDPSPARWKTLLIDLKQEKMSREAKLALFQLMRETNSITRPEDYAEFAKLAIVSNQPGVAKRALDEAKAAGAVPATDQQGIALLNAATDRAAQAQAELPKLPATPAGFMTAGNTYLGLGDYPKAVGAYTKVAVGNSPQADQARLLLGISQVRAGQTAAARKTFGTIAPTSTFKDVASLWSLYASSRG
ncbi:MAG: tetratricopeptide repeat protein [Sphingomonadaceae bacterium]|nr:tetratricopeptide repeat protein [Sphingomonadaceae bacterium]